jgi:hypothetical protein
LAGNLVKPLLSLYGTEWRERGYGLSLDKPITMDHGRSLLPPSPWVQEINIPEQFERIVSKDALGYLDTSSSPRQQEDAGMAQGEP